MVWTPIDNGLVIFNWLVLRMRMQVILDSLFARPGFSPYMGREDRRVQGLACISVSRLLQKL